MSTPDDVRPEQTHAPGDAEPPSLPAEASEHSADEDSGDDEAADSVARGRQREDYDDGYEPV